MPDRENTAVASDDTGDPASVHVLIPAAVQRRMAERVAELRDEIAAFVASLPPAQEPRT